MLSELIVSLMSNILIQVMIVMIVQSNLYLEVWCCAISYG